MMEFPTDAAAGVVPFKLPIVINPTYPLVAGALAQLSPHLRISERVLDNNYEYHVGKRIPRLFECAPYSRLAINADKYAVGITVLPKTVLRYDLIRTEHLSAMDQAARGIRAWIPFRQSWPDPVKDVYEIMKVTALKVNEYFPVTKGELRQTRLSYMTFTGDLPAAFAIYELHVS